MKMEDPGYQWEKAVFGISSEGGGKFYPMSQIAATRKVLQEQGRLGWNADKPHTTVGHELVECVRSYLRPEEALKLKLYCAVGTTLDFMHSTDGFFMIGNRVLPIDLKSGSPPPNYANGSFLLKQRECNGMSMWRPCFKIARALVTEGTGIYTYIIK